MIVELPNTPKRRSTQQQRDTPDPNEKYGAKSRGGGWLVSQWRRWGALDRTLAVVAFVCVAAEIIVRLMPGDGESAAEGGDGNAAAAAASVAAAKLTVFGISAKQAGVIGCVLGASLIALWACRRNNRNSQSGSFQLRDRNASKRGSGACCAPCFASFANWWRTASLFDRGLLVCVFLFLGADGIMTLQEHGMPKVKIPSLRGTPAPTAAPTPVPPPPPEDPRVVASAIESAATNKYAKPAECTAEQISKVQSSGVSGEKCSGRPFGQTCSFSVLTKAERATWLGKFAEEVLEARAADKNTTHTFLGILVNFDTSDCPKIDGHLQHLSAEAGKGILEKPGVYCSIPGGTSKDIKDKWGINDSGAPVDEKTENGRKSMDQFMIDNGEEKKIKDVVHINTAADSVRALNGGLVTLARTRYVEFQYDWQGAWRSNDLKTVVTRLDELGHTCYWPGDGKLWRITGCWQSFYGFKSYSNVACVNRNLAPKLAESMERIFLETIGN